MITAIVPAAGESARMGPKDKLFLQFGGQTVIETVIHAINDAAVDRIIVVLNDLSKSALLPTLNKVSYLLNPNSDAGLTSSIQTGISKSIDGSDFLVCLGDMPLLQYHHYNKLINCKLDDSNKFIIQPLKGARRGNPVLFSAHFKDQLLALRTPNGCKPVISSNEAVLRLVEVESSAYFSDIDSPEDYDILLNRIS